MNPCIYIETAGLRTLVQAVRLVSKEDNVALIERSDSSAIQSERMAPGWQELINEKDWKAYSSILIHGGLEFVEQAAETKLFSKYVFPIDGANSHERMAKAFGVNYTHSHGEIRTSFELTTEWYSNKEPIYIAPEFESNMWAGEYTRRQFRDACILNQIKPTDTFMVDGRYSPPIQEWMVWVVQGQVIEALQHKENDLFSIKPHASVTQAQHFVKDHVIPALGIDTYVAHVTFDNQWRYRVRNLTCINNTLWYDPAVGVKVIRAWLNVMEANKDAS
jgi:hypothetical protein